MGRPRLNQSGIIRGARGLPGPDAIPADNAVAAYVLGPSATQTTLDSRYATTDSVGEYVETHAPEIAAAAAALAASDAGLVRKTDPGIPVDNDNTVYTDDGIELDEVTLTPDDRRIEGRYGGTKVLFGAERIGDEIAHAEFSALDVAGGTGIVASLDEHPGNGYRAENEIGSDGNVPMWVLDRQRERQGLYAGPTFTGGRTEQPMDIWLIMGQSNSTKRGYVAPLNGDTDWLQYWNLTFDAWMNEADSGPWLGSGIARAWWKREGMFSGRQVGAIEAGIGGTGFSGDYNVNVEGTLQTTNWDQTNVTAAVNLATRARDMAEAALAAAPDGSRIVGVIWSQGEADRNQTGMEDGGYAAKLDSLIAWFRTELALPTLPWIVTGFTPQVVQADDPGTADILAQLEDTPRRVEYTSYLHHAPDDSDEIGGTVEDVHWHPHATHRRGEVAVIEPDYRCDSAYDCAVMNYAAARFRTPPALAITRSGGEALITWRSPAARVVSYVLETNVNGAGWNAETLAPETGIVGAITYQHSKSVAAGTPLWARISAVCSTGTSLPSVEVHA